MQRIVLAVIALASFCFWSPMVQASTAKVDTHKAFSVKDSDSDNVWLREARTNDKSSRHDALCNISLFDTLGHDNFRGDDWAPPRGNVRGHDGNDGRGNYDHLYAPVDVPTLPATVETAAVPEPASLLLIGAALAGLGGLRRKK